MNRRVVFGVLLALVLIAGAVSLGVYAYNTDVFNCQRVALQDFLHTASIQGFR